MEWANYKVLRFQPNARPLPAAKTVFNLPSKFLPMKPRVVIAGCGFGGATVAFNLKRLAGNMAKIIAIDSSEKFDYHASLPELAAGKIRESEITIPLQQMLGRKGIKFVRAKVSRIDFGKRKVITGKSSIAYDFLVLALGARTAFYGIPGADENCLEFKSYRDASKLHAHIVSLFRSCSNAGKASDSTKIVVVGGGLTGVELAADLADMLDKLCMQCGIMRDDAQIVLVHRSPHLHPALSEEVSAFTENYLRLLGIRLQLGKAVVEVKKGSVVLEGGAELRAKTIVWCAGIQPADAVSSAGEKNFDPRCGIVLNNYLQSVGDRRVFAVGDCGWCSTFETHPVLSYLRAVEHADFVSHNLYAELSSKPHRKLIYSPRTFPTMISLGRKMGILVFGSFYLAGLQWVWAKKLVARIHLFRFRTGLDFLEFADELFVSFIEFAYYLAAKGR